MQVAALSVPDMVFPQVGVTPRGAYASFGDAPDAENSMIAENRRLFMLILTLASIPLQGARSASIDFQGAWLEETESCPSVFIARPNSIDFRQPASAFAPAFIVTGKRLSTPLATCRIVDVSPIGPRQVLRLDCTTSIATNSARAVFARSEDGGLYRYHALDGGIATKYRLCSREALQAP